MANHLPTEDMIGDYAVGGSAPGLSLLMVAHLTAAPESRAGIAVVDAMGGALLNSQSSAEMAGDALDRALTALGEPDIAEKSEGHGTGPLPGVVVDRLGMQYDDIPWKFVMPGVASYDLAGFENEHVSLLRAKPGVKLPQHTHDGVEATLVLQGQMMDDGVVYARGDIAVNDHDDDHRPEVVGDEVCVCLVVRQGDLRFTGLFSRVLNYIGE